MTTRKATLLKLGMLALPLALVAALGWALATASGLRFVLARGDAALAKLDGGGISVGRSDGALARGFVLEDVVIAFGAGRLRIHRVQGELRPAPLLVGRLSLVALELDGVDLTLPVDADPTPFVLPERIDLPVHLAVERFVARGVRVALGATPPVEFDELSGRASADARGLKVEDARISGRGLRADGSLALALEQPYATEGAMRLRLERPDLPPVAGNAALSGRLEALRVAIRLEAPLAARADLALDDPFGVKRIAGRIEAGDADLTPLVPALEGWRFDADLALSGSLASPRLDGKLAARGPDLPQLRATLGARLAGSVVDLDRLGLTVDGRATRLDGRGRVTLDGDDLPFTLDLRASDPLLPTATLALRGDLARATGTLSARGAALGRREGGRVEAAVTLEPRVARAGLSGSITAWPLPGDATLDAESFEFEYGAGRGKGEARGTLARGALRAGVTLRATVDPDRIMLASLELGLLGGHATATGHMERGGAHRWQATLRATDLDPRGLDARFPGRLSARLELGGSPSAPTLELAGLSGELRGRKVGGHARLHHGRAPELVALGLPEFVVEDLELSAGAAHAKARANRESAELEVVAPDLADLLPNARGELELRAQRAADGALGATAKARALQLGGSRIATLDASLDAPADGGVDASLAVAGLSSADLALDTLHATARGERRALALSVEATSSGTGFVAEARGALQPQGFDGELTRWELAPVDAARWTLAQPAALTVGADGARIGEACASDGKARACLVGGWHPLEPWHAEARVEHLGIDAFRGYLPRGLAYAGDIDLQAHVAGTGPTLGPVRAELLLSSGNIEATVRRGATSSSTRLIGFSGGRVILEHEAQRLHIGARLALAGADGAADGGKLEAELTASGGGAFDARPLSGRIVAHAEQFALLPVLLPEVKQLSGKLEADLAVSGTVGAPRFAGEAAFHGGSASVPRLGLDLSEVEFVLTGDGDALDARGSARAGGTLEWRAKLRRGADGWTADGTLTGDRFRALNVPEARIIASPDLAFSYAADRLSVTGTVTVPQARIAPRSLSSAVQASSDEVIVGEDATAGGSDTLSVDARVHVALGDAVQFEGFGLKAGIEGGLTLIEKPGSLTLASGELALRDGKYEAYGQLLAIKRGKLLFSGGPVADPGLDVRAQRVIEGASEVTVGLDVRGTLREPELTLFSDPAMSSSEQLSYLVLGRSLVESTEGDQKLIGDAAQSMKLSGGELIAQQIGMRIGLDEVKIEDSGDQTDAQLWLGTYLSPRLFVSYGIGLFEDFYSARVRYDISTKWTVEAESGRESSADFKYTIER